MVAVSRHGSSLQLVATVTRLSQKTESAYLVMTVTVEKQKFLVPHLAMSGNNPVTEELALHPRLGNSA